MRSLAHVGHVGITCSVIFACFWSISRPGEGTRFLLTFRRHTARRAFGHTRRKEPAPYRDLDRFDERDRTPGFSSGFVGIRILIGWMLYGGIRGLHPMLKSFPLFPLALLGGIAVQSVSSRLKIDRLLDRQSFERIQGLALDFLSPRPSHRSIFGSYSITRPPSPYSCLRALSGCSR
jgi:hypothetical protein